ncbi:MAG: hypothetical protein D6675_05470 [Gemmatimonadetes bacterium]|nr:MAG: hypothetical protein D6675_05470 [Gemmatimonadota bacterium]
MKIPIFLVIFVFFYRAIAAQDLYVAPDGCPEGLGTLDSPLDVVTAFTDTNRVIPGTTVWFREGVYEISVLKNRNHVHGTKDNPVIWRALPHNRVTLHGRMVIYQDDFWLWGFEIEGSDQTGVKIHGGNSVKLINLIVYDHAKSGIFVSPNGGRRELYGNIIVTTQA